MHKAIIHLRHIFHQIAVIDESPSFFLTRVDSMNLDKQSVSKLCRHQAKIIRDVNNQTKFRGQNTFNESGAITSVDPKEFKREIAILTLLAGKINFTPQLHAWINDCMDKIAFQMAQDKTYRSLYPAWKGMDDNETLAYIEKMSRLQLSVFNQSGLHFKPARITIMDLPESTWADFQLEGNQFDPDPKPLIRISDAIIHEPVADKTLKSLIHEQIHSVLRQMGAMHAHKKIPRTHFLYKDAELMRHRMAEGSYIPHSFGSAHYAETEERLCHASHNSFLPRYVRYTSRPKTPEPSPA